MDVICSLQFEFSDGSVSPQFGTQVAIKESIDVPPHQQISKVAICVRENMDYMEAMVVIDQNDEPICSFSGEAVTGKWQTFTLEKGENIIGVKATQCDRYVRGLGFFLWN